MHVDVLIKKVVKTSFDFLINIQMFKIKIVDI
jgi:hypothetical protein